jgi:hypothetical protein
MLQKIFNSVHFDQGVKYEKKKFGHVILNSSLPQSPKNTIQIWAIMLRDAWKKPCPVKLTD